MISLQYVLVLDCKASGCLHVNLVGSSIAGVVTGGKMPTITMSHAARSSCVSVPLLLARVAWVLLQLPWGLLKQALALAIGQAA